MAKRTSTLLDPKSLTLRERKRNQMPIEEVRRRAIHVLNLISDFKATDRARILDKAREINDV